MDAEKIDFSPNQFDLIYFCEVIEHIPNPEKVLRSIYALLKPEGTLILSTPNGLNLVGFKKGFLKLFRYDWDSPYGAGQPELHVFTPMSIRTMLFQCGFDIKKVRGSEFLDNLAMLYPSKIAMGMFQFLPLLFSPFQKLKNGFVQLGKTRLFRNFGLEMFVQAIPLKKQFNS
jgi:SAM-dependent methyltransferase